MGLFSEFKKFAMRGNVVDMAVGVVIGGAFGLIVTEIVGKVITPIIGYLQGGVDFKDAVWTLPVPELAEGDESADDRLRRRSAGGTQLHHRRLRAVHGD